MSTKIFTSEAVLEGHPDKICDQIADRILDELLKKDSLSRVACEVTVNLNTVHIFGEITSKAKIDYEKITRDTIKEIGYCDDKLGFNYKTCKIICNIKNQSPDIAMGVNTSLESKHKKTEYHDLGAGDQGIMFGYACKDTPQLMPFAIVCANDLAKELSLVRKKNIIPYLRPDGKCQVTVEYQNDIPVRVNTVVVSVQHDSQVSHAKIQSDIIQVIKSVIPEKYLDERTNYYINSTGNFVLGGPACDSGLTGRKLICDTYGGYSKHGGGSFSGKDATKVDRSATYMARYMAKNIVAAGLAKKCEIQLGYAIGVAKPISIRIETFGTEKIPECEIQSLISNLVDLRVSKIIELFELQKPIFSKVSCYGHFGDNAKDLPWEGLELSEKIREIYSL